MARIPRIHVPSPLAVGAEVPLGSAAAGHLHRVLRMSAGAQVVLFDGRGGEYPARLTALDRQGGSAEVLAHRAVDRESPLRVTLGQGISRGERMDQVIQKSVELGVGAVQPLFTERCVVQLKGARLERRLEHWRSIAVGACEQCGRNVLPMIEPPLALRDWLAIASETPGLLLDPTAVGGLADMAPAAAVRLLIGPEGGLSAQEIDACLQAGFRGIRLGERVMRTETAPLAALAALQTLWGDLGG